MLSTIAPLASDRIHYDGQIVAVVVADTAEIADEAAGRLHITYAEEKPSATFGSPGLTHGRVDPGPAAAMPTVGDPITAFDAAPVTVDAHYATPPQHHNPMELMTTVCSWEGGKLLVWEPSQNVHGARQGLAGQLGMNQADVRFSSPLIGGGFGLSGELSQRTALVALASRMIGRPVRLETTRQQGFTISQFRAETRHHVRLAASRDGRLQALIHDILELSSRPDDFSLGAGSVAMTTRMYACPNVSGSAELVHADRNTPGWMRAPVSVPSFFALESAMDELAVALDIDPIELRRRNDTQTEPINGRPFTSRTLMRCFDTAADAFGWAERDPRPGSMRDGDWLIGWGCASAALGAIMTPASARVTLFPGGSATVQTTAHEIGQGALTTVAMAVVQELGTALSAVTVEIGDTDLPPAGGAGGSASAASICVAVTTACRDIRTRLVTAAVETAGSPFRGADPATLTLDDGALCGPGGTREPLPAAIQRAASGVIESYAETAPHGAPPDAIQRLHRGLPLFIGGEGLPDRIQRAFGANFVEVRVHERTREIWVPRLAGAYGAGRIINPLTARSQLMGGQIWGASAALHEATEIDERTARYTNADLAAYLIPVNADIIDVETIMVPEEDSLVNELGIKGLGKLGIVGLNAAVANAPGTACDLHPHRPRHPSAPRRHIRRPGPVQSQRRERISRPPPHMAHPTRQQYRSSAFAIAVILGRECRDKRRVRHQSDNGAHGRFESTEQLPCRVGERLVLRREIVLVCDGLDRADRLARAAVDTLVGVDIHHPPALVDTVDRALV
jgi:xanthine dehydrogenase YagR molybdenum-binding subunit